MQSFLKFSYPSSNLSPLGRLVRMHLLPKKRIEGFIPSPFATPNYGVASYMLHETDVELHLFAMSVARALGF